MKTSELKKIIKESVKEAIHEELKDILLEAVKSPKIISQTPSTPVPAQPQVPTPTTPQMTLEQKRSAYSNAAKSCIRASTCSEGWSDRQRSLHGQDLYTAPEDVHTDLGYTDLLWTA